MNKQDKKIMMILGIITFICYTLFTNLLNITDPVESNYALTAKEMIQHRSFISPMIFGNAWYDKPPLTYWFLMASFKLFGFNDFAARIPANLTSTAVVVAMYGATRKLTGSMKIALWSSIALATSLEFWYVGHAIITDGYLLLSSLGIFTFGFLAFTHENRNHMRLAYISAGFAVLAKGPVGILLPGLIFLLYLIFLQKKKPWGILFDPLGIVLFFIVCGPWYGAMYQIHGEDFISGFLGVHNITRATVSEHPAVNVWYYYLALMPVYLLPWTFYAFLEIKRNWRNTLLRKYQLLWIAIVFLFYSLVATKYITYTYIALVPFFMIIGDSIVKLIENPLSKRWQSLLLLLPLALLTITLIVASYIEPHIKINFPIIATIGTLILINLIGFSIWGHPKKFHKVIATSMACILLALPIIIQPLIEVRSTKVLSKTVESYKPQNVYFLIKYRTSYSFYTDRAPVLINDEKAYPLDKWDWDKMVMPYIDIKDYIGKYKQQDKTIIIVPQNYEKTFLTYPIAKDFHKVTVYDQFLLYANYSVDKDQLANTKK